MNFLSRIFGKQADPRHAIRPLWLRLIEISREQGWYAKLGVSDSVGGRFDMVASVLALVMIRLEKEGNRGEEIALLAELFVEDMDGQLRELGVGDISVSKHMGKLMSVLGGRQGAFRDALKKEDNTALAEAVDRNILLLEGGDPADIASALRKLEQDLNATPVEDLLAGSIAR